MAGSIMNGIEDDWAWLAKDLAISKDELVQGASAFKPHAANFTSQTVESFTLMQLVNEASLSKSSYNHAHQLKDESRDDMPSSNENHRDEKSSSSEERSSDEQRDDDHQNKPEKRDGPDQEAKSFVKLNEYKSIGAVIQVTYEYPNLSPKHISAVWTSLSRLVIASCRHQYREPPKHLIAQQQKQLGVIVSRTLEGLKSKHFNPVFISQTALGIAKIIKAALNCTPKPQGHTHRMFREVLVHQKDFIFDSITCAIFPFLGDLDAQGFSNISYSYAVSKTTSSFDGRSIFEYIADQIVTLDDDGMKQFNTQNLTNIVWSFATANKIVSWNQDPIQRLFNKLLSELTQKDPITFEQQHLSNCVWAYSKLDIPAPTLFSKVAKEVEHRDKSGKEVFSPQSLTNLVWSFAMAKAPDCDSLFKAVASQIIRRSNLKRFKPQELSNISWSYANATAAVSPPDRDSLFKKIAAELAGRHDWRPFSSHHMATIAWSFATVNHRAPMVFNPAFNNALHIKIEEFSPMELSQLYQWHLFQTVEYVPGISKTRGSGLNHPVLISKCYTAFASQQSKVYSVQRDVICTLQSLGLRPKSEVLTKHGFRVDATVVVEGRIVGIEVILRRHVIGDKPSNHKPTGGTFMKRRQLERVENMKLVSIPYYEWDALGHHGSAVRAKKQDYLLSILGLKN